MPERMGVFMRSVPLGVGRAGNQCVSGGQAGSLLTMQERRKV